LASVGSVQCAWLVTEARVSLCRGCGGYFGQISFEEYPFEINFSAYKDGLLVAIAMLLVAL